MAGTLILCAGPIGNLSDAPPSLAEALRSADVIYVEDTRRSRVLLDRLEVSGPTRSYFVGNESRRAAELRHRLAAGDTVALLTDAGTPSIADPGLSAVRQAIAAGARVTVVPGPSAVTAALALSGLPADRFVFEGFLPRRGAARQARLAAIADDERTVVLFAAPHRLGADLLDLAAAMPGERTCVVCREISKMNEEVWRGTLAEAAAHWSAIEPRGEVTVVLGPPPSREADTEGAVEEVAALVRRGASTSDAVRRVAAERGMSRRRLYQAVLKGKTSDIRDQKSEDRADI